MGPSIIYPQDLRTEPVREIMFNSDSYSLLIARRGLLVRAVRGVFKTYIQRQLFYSFIIF